jgi:hypothetical protein
MPLAFLFLDLRHGDSVLDFHSFRERSEQEKKNSEREPPVKKDFAVSKRIRTFAFRNIPCRIHENHEIEGALAL